MTVRQVVVLYSMLVSRVLYLAIVVEESVVVWEGRWESWLKADP